MEIPKDILSTLSIYTNTAPMPFTVLSESGEIVGEIVDQNNMLIYVMRKDEQLFMKYATEVKVVINRPPIIEEIPR